ncbi:MAG TPA: AIM24 family protein, partial [Thermoanaerobaculia bacterium]|nr:AIM24 family protein [Thermoanaerobaculia bacterium]
MNDRFWYVAVGGQQQGPWSTAEVQDSIRNGRFGRDAYVFSEGMANWVPITSQAELASAFGPAVSAAPPPPPPMRSAAHEIDYELFGQEMQYVEITLDPGEACVAEAGAFLYMEPGIEMATIFGDGSGQEGSGLMGKLLTAGKRVLTGESLFMTVFSNSGGTRQKVAFA